MNFIFPEYSIEKSVCCYSNDLLKTTINSLIDYNSHVCDSYTRQRNNFHLKYQFYFYQFCRACIDIASSRKLNSNHGLLEKSLETTYPTSEILERHKPTWMGWTYLHEMHRSFLIFTGECELTFNRLAVYLNVEPTIFSRKTQRWLDTKGFISNVFRWDKASCYDLNSYLNSLGVPTYTEPNHYAQFGWDVTDKCDYCFEWWQ
jgi:hypothetical protein